MGWSIRITALLVIFSSEIYFTFGTVEDIWTNSQSVENMSRSFIDFILQSGVLNEDQMNDINSISDIILSTFGKTGLPSNMSKSKAQALNIALATSIAEIVFANQLEIPVFVKTNSIMNALRYSFLQTAGTIDEGFLNEMKELIDTIALESLNELSDSEADANEDNGSQTDSGPTATANVPGSFSKDVLGQGYAPYSEFPSQGYGTGEGITGTAFGRFSHRISGAGDPVQQYSAETGAAATANAGDSEGIGEIRYGATNLPTAQLASRAAAPNRIGYRDDIGLRGQGNGLGSSDIVSATAAINSGFPRSDDITQRYGNKPYGGTGESAGDDQGFGAIANAQAVTGSERANRSGQGYGYRIGIRGRGNDKGSGGVIATAAATSAGSLELGDYRQKYDAIPAAGLGDSSVQDSGIPSSTGDLDFVSAFSNSLSSILLYSDDFTSAFGSGLPLDKAVNAAIAVARALATQVGLNDKAINLMLALFNDYVSAVGTSVDAPSYANAISRAFGGTLANTGKFSPSITASTVSSYAESIINTINAIAPTILTPSKTELGRGSGYDASATNITARKGGRNRGNAVAASAGVAVPSADGSSTSDTSFLQRGSTSLGASGNGDASVGLGEPEIGTGAILNAGSTARFVKTNERGQGYGAPTELRGQGYNSVPSSSVPAAAASVAEFKVLGRPGQGYDNNQNFAALASSRVGEGIEGLGFDDAVLANVRSVAERTGVTADRQGSILPLGNGVSSSASASASLAVDDEGVGELGYGTRGIANGRAVKGKAKGNRRGQVNRYGTGIRGRGQNAGRRSSIAKAAAASTESSGSGAFGQNYAAAAAADSSVQDSGISNSTGDVEFISAFSNSLSSTLLSSDNFTSGFGSGLPVDKAVNAAIAIARALAAQIGLDDRAVNFLLTLFNDYVSAVGSSIDAPSYANAISRAFGGTLANTGNLSPSITASTVSSYAESIINTINAIAPTILTPLRTELGRGKVYGSGAKTITPGKRGRNRGNAVVASAGVAVPSAAGSSTSDTTFLQRGSSSLGAGGNGDVSVGLGELEYGTGAILNAGSTARFVETNERGQGYGAPTGLRGQGYTSVPSSSVTAAAATVAESKLFGRPGQGYDNNQNFRDLAPSRVGDGIEDLGFGDAVLANVRSVAARTGVTADRPGSVLPLANGVSSSASASASLAVDDGGVGELGYGTRGIANGLAVKGKAIGNRRGQVNGYGTGIRGRGYNADRGSGIATAAAASTESLGSGASGQKYDAIAAAAAADSSVQDSGISNSTDDIEFISAFSNSLSSILLSSDNFTSVFGRGLPVDKAVNAAIAIARALATQIGLDDRAVNFLLALFNDYVSAVENSVDAPAYADAISRAFGSTLANTGNLSPSITSTTVSSYAESIITTISTIIPAVRIRSAPDLDGIGNGYGSYGNDVADISSGSNALRLGNRGSPSGSNSRSFALVVGNGDISPIGSLEKNYISGSTAVIGGAEHQNRGYDVAADAGTASGRARVGSLGPRYNVGRRIGSRGSGLGAKAGIGRRGFVPGVFDNSATYATAGAGASESGSFGQSDDAAAAERGASTESTVDRGGFKFGRRAIGNDRAAARLAVAGNFGQEYGVVGPNVGVTGPLSLGQGYSGLEPFDTAVSTEGSDSSVIYSSPAASQRISSAISSLISGGSLNLNALPTVISNLAGQVSSSTSDLSNTEIAIEALIEIASALVHILSYANIGDVNYDELQNSSNLVRQAINVLC